MCHKNHAIDILQYIDPFDGRLYYPVTATNRYNIGAFPFSPWPVFVQQSVEHASVAPGRGEVDAAEAGVAFCRLLAP